MSEKLKAGMRIRIRWDPLIFGPPDPVLFSLDPNLSNYFHLGTIYKPESTNSSLKWWFMRSNYMPTYLKYKYIFFFILILSRIRIFFSWAGSGSMEKNVGSSSLDMFFFHHSTKFENKNSEIPNNEPRNPKIGYSLPVPPILITDT